MRPTLLNFRSPKEKTPDYYDSTITHEGDTLNFRSKSINRKQSNMSQAQRFQEHQYIQGGSGVSCFLGPGCYNDQEDYLKLMKAPCASVMKKISAVNVKESGKPCYIMIGNNLTFEPSFISSQSKKDNQDLNASDCKVSIGATMHRRSISQVKQRINNVSVNTTTQQYTSEREKEYQNKVNQVSSSLIQNDSEFEKTNTARLQEFQRPNTCNQCKRKTGSFGGVNSFNQSQSTKYSMSGAKNQGDNFLTSQISNIDKSTTIDPSMNNLQGIREETNQSKETRQHRQMSVSTDVNQVRVRSMLPKTAVNFHKMKKGLYLNPLRGYPIDIKQEALARSLNILQAYGELMPMLFAKRPKSKSKKPKGKNKMFEEDVEKNNRYMAVIRDSPATLQKKENLEKQKNEIMSMNFDNFKKVEVNKMNDFIAERYKSDIDEDINIGQSKNK